MQFLKSALKFGAKLVLPIAVLVAAAAAYGALKASKPGVNKREAPEAIAYVKAINASFNDHQPVLHLYGETTAGRQVELRALVGGEVKVVNIGLRDGAVVDKGVTLLQIDPFDFDGALVEARARLNEAKARLDEISASYRLEESGLKFDRAQLEIARRDLARAESLVKRETVSKKLVDDRSIIVTQRRQELERRENNLNVWRAKAEQQRSVIKRLEWGVRFTERRRERTRLVAPFDAYVSDANAEVGRLLNVNDRVATLIDRNWIEVRFTLTDRQYGQIVSQEGTVVGRKVDVRWRLGSRSLTYPARIKRVAAKINAARGGVDVYARLDDPLKPVGIRVGAFVEVFVQDRKYQSVMRLPRTSIYNRSTIYVIEKGRLVARKVEIVGQLEGDFLVRGSIKPGDRIVRTRLTRPGVGLKVKEI